VKNPRFSSAKYNAQYLAQLLKQHQCKTIVIAPGSRNAPLLIAFSQDEDYRCVSVPDERVAAFTAMGMTLEKREPVAVICSSGSAAVNFYPAVAEAYYQELPLVVITADRPKELIDQGIGQTMRQENIFEQHIQYSANLLRDPADGMAHAYNQRLINEALLATKKGPVHINVPFDEPLYETTDTLAEARFIDELKGERVLRTSKLNQLAEVWNSSPKIWVLAGQLLPDDELEETLNQLNVQSPFLIFSESLSNLHCGCNIHCIDRLINTLSEKEKQALQPDLLISIGGEVVSKMVKKYLRTFTPKQHWYVNERTEFQDTYGALTQHVQVHPALFFQALHSKVHTKPIAWRDAFLALDEQRMHALPGYLEKAHFSDFTAFKQVLSHLPENSILHCANSTSVRYAQLFDHPKDILHFANRGTSGIDGCTSTAVGHAMASDKPITLITGDVAFLYDSNAFWNNQLPNNLRVVVLNNSGGNIFRIIEGPDDSPHFEAFQETVHQHKLEGVAHTYGLDFTSVSTAAELDTALAGFYTPAKRIKILEIHTPRLESPRVLKSFFEYLRTL
jgi:2-succinyl-5-enolpyruvyl-6-hydroxy-3-cyclohexene-1-carboxylate synthase